MKKKKKVAGEKEEKRIKEEEEKKRIEEYRTEAMKTPGVYVLLRSGKCLTVRATDLKHATVIASEFPKWRIGDKIYLSGNFTEWKSAWPRDRRGDSFFFPTEDERIKD